MRSSKALNSFIKRCAALAMLWAGVVSAAHAQQSIGLRVRVTDAQQRPVAGAVCSLRPANSNEMVVANATTDEHGLARFSAAPLPGNYSLRVESPGFETFERRSVVVK